MSFVGPPWPAQTIRIAGAASYCVTLAVGQTIAASPAAKSGLNRPRLKEELRPVGANVRARGIWRCDTQKQESSIRVVGIKIVPDKKRSRLTPAPSVVIPLSLEQ